MIHRLNNKAQAGLAALFLFALWLAGLHWFTRDVLNETPALEAAAPADAIVVLTGGSHRLQTGFDLLDRKLGRKLFISGVYRGVEIQELMKQWSKEKQSEIDCCVVLGFDADNTIGNARETAQWVRREKLKSIYLVTSNYHMQRAVLEFRDFSPTIKIIPWPVIPEGLNMQNWWRNSTYRSLIIREYSKYVAALLLSAVTESPA